MNLNYLIVVVEIAIPLISRVWVGYKISSLLSDDLSETSIKLLRKVEEHETRLGDSNFGTLSLSIQLTSLLIRCLPGLEINKEVFDFAQEFVLKQIERTHLNITS